MDFTSSRTKKTAGPEAGRRLMLEPWKVQRERPMTIQDPAIAAGPVELLLLLAEACMVAGSPFMQPIKAPARNQESTS
jgi:hypothetical protein